MEEDEAAILRNRGYIPVDVRAMPRGTPQEHAEAIEAWLQGMSEGTIPPDMERRRTLELEAKAHGLLLNRSTQVKVEAKLDGATLEDLLQVGRTRFVNQRAITDERLLAAKRASVIPGEKLLDDEEMN
jgi:hypothetical protein